MRNPPQVQNLPLRRLGGLAVACWAGALALAAPPPLAEIRTDGGAQRYYTGFTERPALVIPGGESFQHRGKQDLQIPLQEPLGARGTMAVWFYVQAPLEAGPESTQQRHALLALPGLVEVQLRGNTHSQMLVLVWQGRSATEVIMPSLPGPEWYHLAVSWDAPTGRMGVWLNGTGYYLPDARVPAWPEGEASAVVLPSGGVPLSRLQLWPEPLSEEQVLGLVPEVARGTLDRLMGVAPLGAWADEPRRGAPLHDDDFLQPTAAAAWRSEGPLVVKHRNGWVELASEVPDGPGGHVVWWCPLELPDSFYAEWEFEILSERGLCIVFFAAHRPGGGGLFEPGVAARDGTFQQYIFGDIATYHVSYWAHTPEEPRAMANLRKSPGFFLLGNGPMLVRPQPGQIYRATLLKEGCRIRMAIDGELIIDVLDDGRFGPAWGGGSFGLRQMSWTHARYRNLAFFALRPPADADVVQP